MNIFRSSGEADKKLAYYAALSSVGVFIYVGLVVWFMNHAEKIFGKANSILAGMTMLMVFILSALITGSLVLGRPVMYYLDSKKSEAVKLLFYTMTGLFILLLLAIGGLILIK